MQKKVAQYELAEEDKFVPTASEEGQIFDPMEVPEGIRCEAFLDGERIEGVVVRRRGVFFFAEEGDPPVVHQDFLLEGYKLRPL